MILDRFKRFVVLLLTLCIICCGLPSDVYAYLLLEDPSGYLKYGAHNLMAKNVHIIASPYEGVNADDVYKYITLNIERSDGSFFTVEASGYMYDTILQSSYKFYGDGITIDGFGQYESSCTACNDSMQVDVLAMREVMCAIKSLDVGNTYNINIKNFNSFEITIPYHPLNSDEIANIDSILLDYAAYEKNDGTLVTYNNISEIVEFPYNHVNTFENKHNLCFSDSNNFISFNHKFAPSNLNYSDNHDAFWFEFNTDIISDEFYNKVDKSVLYNYDSVNKTMTNDLSSIANITNLTFENRDDSTIIDGLNNANVVYQDYYFRRASNTLVSFDIEVTNDDYYIPLGRDYYNYSEIFTTDCVRYLVEDGVVKVGIDLDNILFERKGGTNNINIQYSTYKTYGMFDDSDYLRKDCILNEDTTYIIDNIMLDDGTKHSITKDHNCLANIYVNGILEEDRMYGYYASSYFNYYLPKIVGNVEYKVKSIVSTEESTGDNKLSIFLITEEYYNSAMIKFYDKYTNELVYICSADNRVKPSGYSILLDDSGYVIEDLDAVQVYGDEISIYCVPDVVKVPVYNYDNSCKVGYIPANIDMSTLVKEGSYFCNVRYNLDTNDISEKLNVDFPILCITYSSSWSDTSAYSNLVKGFNLINYNGSVVGMDGKIKLYDYYTRDIIDTPLRENFQMPEGYCLLFDKWRSLIDEEELLNSYADYYYCYPISIDKNVYEGWSPSTSKSILGTLKFKVHPETIIVDDNNRLEDIELSINGLSSTFLNNKYYDKWILLDKKYKIKKDNIVDSTRLMLSDNLYAYDKETNADKCVDNNVQYKLGSGYKYSSDKYSINYYYANSDDLNDNIEKIEMNFSNYTYSISARDNFDKIVSLINKLGGKSKSLYIYIDTVTKKFIVNYCYYNKLDIEKDMKPYDFFNYDKNSGLLTIYANVGNIFNLDYIEKSNTTRYNLDSDTTEFFGFTHRQVPYVETSKGLGLGHDFSEKAWIDLPIPSTQSELDSLISGASNNYNFDNIDINKVISIKKTECIRDDSKCTEPKGYMLDINYADLYVDIINYFNHDDKISYILDESNNKIIKPDKYICLVDTNFNEVDVDALTVNKSMTLYGIPKTTDVQLRSGNDGALLDEVTTDFVSYTKNSNNLDVVYSPITDLFSRRYNAKTYKFWTTKPEELSIGTPVFNYYTESTNTEYGLVLYCLEEQESGKSTGCERSGQPVYNAPYLRTKYLNSTKELGSVVNNNKSYILDVGDIPETGVYFKLPEIKTESELWNFRGLSICEFVDYSYKAHLGISVIRYADDTFKICVYGKSYTGSYDIGQGDFYTLEEYKDKVKNDPYVKLGTIEKGKKYKIYGCNNKDILSYNEDYDAYLYYTINMSKYCNNDNLYIKKDDSSFETIDSSFISFKWDLDSAPRYYYSTYFFSKYAYIKLPKSVSNEKSTYIDITHTTYGNSIDIYTSSYKFYYSSSKLNKCFNNYKDLISDLIDRNLVKIIDNDYYLIIENSKFAYPNSTSFIGLTDYTVDGVDLMKSLTPNNFKACNDFLFLEYYSEPYINITELPLGHDFTGQSYTTITKPTEQSGLNALALGAENYDTSWDLDLSKIKEVKKQLCVRADDICTTPHAYNLQLVYYGVNPPIVENRNTNTNVVSGNTIEGDLPLKIYDEDKDIVKVTIDGRDYTPDENNEVIHTIVADNEEHTIYAKDDLGHEVTITVKVNMPNSPTIVKTDGSTIGTVVTGDLEFKASDIDKDLEKVTVDGVDCTLDTNNEVIKTIVADDQSHTIIAVDEVGHETIVTVTVNTIALPQNAPDVIDKATGLAVSNNGIYVGDLQIKVTDIDMDLAEVTVDGVSIPIDLVSNSAEKTIVANNLVHEIIAKDAQGNTTTLTVIVKTLDSFNIKVRGFLKSIDNQPIANAEIQLHSTPRTVTTDENGYYEFDDVELDNHTLKASVGTDEVYSMSLNLTKTQVKAQVDNISNTFTLTSSSEINNDSIVFTVNAKECDNHIHTHKTGDELSATCTTDGYVTDIDYCPTCLMEWSRVTTVKPALGHIWVDDWVKLDTVTNDIILGAENSIAWNGIDAVYRRYCNRARDAYELKTVASTPNPTPTPTPEPTPNPTPEPTPTPIPTPNPTPTNKYVVTVMDKYGDADAVERCKDSYDKGANYRYSAIEKDGYVVYGNSIQEGIVTEDIILTFIYKKDIEDGNKDGIDTPPIEEDTEEIETPPSLNKVMIKVYDKYDDIKSLRKIYKVDFNTKYSYKAKPRNNYKVVGDSVISGIADEDVIEIVFEYEPISKLEIDEDTNIDDIKDEDIIDDVVNEEPNDGKSKTGDNGIKVLMLGIILMMLSRRLRRKK